MSTVFTRFRKYFSKPRQFELVLVLLMLAFLVIANPETTPLFLKTIVVSILAYAGLVVAAGGIRHLRDKEPSSDKTMERRS